MYILENIEKTPLETYKVSLNYQKIFKGDENFDVVLLTATDEATGDDATNLLIDSVYTIEGTATLGSKTRLVDTTKNFAELGVRPGHIFLNVTKNERIHVRELATTMNPFDTLIFAQVAKSEVEAADAYRFFVAPALILPAGVPGKIYRLIWTTTSSLNKVYTHAVRLHVKSL